MFESSVRGGRRSNRRCSKRSLNWIAQCAAVTALLASFAAPSMAQNSQVTRKLLRQIGVMEKVFDEVLIDSPNFLVSGRGNVRGTYLQEFGVLLTFEASLVNDDDWDEYDWRGHYEVKKDKDGRTVIILPDDHDEDDDHDDDKYDDKHDDDKEHWGGDRWSTRKNRAERRLYTRGKVELKDAIMDYGDTLNELEDNHWVAVAAFLRDSNFFIDEKISRLIMRVRMKDLRDYARSKIDEDELQSRIVEEEY